MNLFYCKEDNKELIIFPKMYVNETPFFNEKVSIAQLSRNINSFNTSPPKVIFKDHIQWDQQKQIKQQPTKQAKQNKPFRRNLFKKVDELNQQKKRKQTVGTALLNQHKLSHATSDPYFPTFHEINHVESPDQRINQINRQLKEHREKLISSRSTQRQISNANSNPPALALIQVKLAESKKILERQEQILNSRMPNFEKKIQSNSAAIEEVRELLKAKMSQQAKKIDNLLLIIQKNEGRVKQKQGELSRINSQLLLKESQIVKSKQERRKRQIQFERIKRIQNLQTKNLQMYMQIQRKDRNDIRFQDYDPELQDENMQQCWGQSQIDSALDKSLNKYSTIQQTERYDQYSSVNNDTIGQLLSPLTLNDHNYVL